ncbi:MAG: LamG-like jellyroll fold domain-containing protein [Patescibacteria group bacterium]
MVNINKRKSAFSLLELLIVMGVLAILTTTVVLIINPVELLKEGRDSKRIVDIRSIDEAIQLAQADNLSLSLGSPNVVYLSLPDTNSNCSSYSLPSLPIGYSYTCQSASNFQKVDGTGWLPIDFTALSTGSPFPVLPIDPENDDNNNLYYTYENGYILTAGLLSNEYIQEVAQKDEGLNPLRFEIGSGISILSIPTNGLIAYWPLEGNFNDYSGRGHNGTPMGGVESSFVAGKSGQAVNFDGINDYANVVSGDLNDFVFNNGQDMTVSFWGKDLTLVSWVNRILGYRSTDSALIGLQNSGGWNNRLNYYASSMEYRSNELTITPGVWHNFTIVKQSDTIYHYFDNVLSGTPQIANPQTDTTGIYIGARCYGLCGGAPNGIGEYTQGAVDQIRVYNRALSTSEIQALYQLGQ